MKSNDFINEGVLSSIGAGLARTGILGQKRYAAQAGKDYVAGNQKETFAAWSNELKRILNTYLQTTSASSPAPVAPAPVAPAPAPVAPAPVAPAPAPVAPAPALNPRAAGANARELIKARRKDRALREDELINFQKIDEIIETIILLPKNDQRINEVLSQYNYLMKIINEAAPVDPTTKNNIISLVKSFVDARLASAGAQLTNKPPNFDNTLNYAIEKFADTYLTNPKQAFAYKGPSSSGEPASNVGPFELIFNTIQTAINMNRPTTGGGYYGGRSGSSTMSQMPAEDIAPVKISDKTMPDASGTPTQVLYGYNATAGKWYRTIDPKATEPATPAGYLDPSRESTNIIALNKKVASGEIHTL